MTLLAVVLPGSIAVGLVWFYVRSHQHQLLQLVLDTRSLLWLTIVLGVGWFLWLALICGTYLRTRPLEGHWMPRLAGGLVVALLCGVATMPMAVGARYAMVQRDLLNTVFSGNTSATTPHATEANPWGDRKRVNVLMLGGDGSIGRPGVRTDSLILASIDVANGNTLLFSLPRNLQRVPFQAGSKLAELYPDGFQGPGNEADYFLNAVYRDVPMTHPGVLGKTDNEGADATKLAVAGVTGIPVDYYVLVNLGGFQQIVDAMGGITVNINEPVPIGGNTDAHILPDSYLEPGPDQRLDGFKALWFTRGRYGSTDYKRMERQRCAINAIIAEADPVNLLRRYTALAQAGKAIVRTDIPKRLLPAFVELALRTKDHPVKSVGFERSAAFDPNDPDFDYVHKTVAAALRQVDREPVASTPGVGTPPGSQAGTGNGRGTGGSQLPGAVTDANQDCAYHPVGASGP